MLFKSLTVNNYFPFKETQTLDCSRDVTVVSGRNNTGKSCLLTALLALRYWKEDSATGLGNRLGWDRATFGRRGGEITISVELDEDLANRAVSDYPGKGATLALRATTTGSRRAAGMLSLEPGKESQASVELAVSQLGGQISRGAAVDLGGDRRRVRRDVHLASRAIPARTKVGRKGTAVPGSRRYQRTAGPQLNVV